MPVVRPSRLRNDANARYRERGEAGRSEPPEWYAKRVGWLTGATGGGRSGGAARQDGETLRQAIAAHSVVRCGYAPELAGEKTELAFAPSADVHLIGEVAPATDWWRTFLSIVDDTRGDFTPARARR